MVGALFSGLHPCCISYRDLVSLAKESAIIVWNEKSKTEHFVRRAEFEGKGEDFGFIFPSPSEPFRIEVVDEDLFREILKHRPFDKSMRGAASADGANRSGSWVEVLQDKTVGDYQVVVLKATDGKAMENWIKKNGHIYRKAMTPWFDYYAKKNWYFTAFKYKKQAEITPTRAVSISFKTEEPFYPYKMPSDTFPYGHYRELDLIVISNSEMSGRFTNGQTWDSKKLWTNVVKDGVSTIKTLLENKKSSMEVPNPFVITVFQNQSEMENYDFEYDLVFSNKTKSPWFYLAIIGVPLLLILLVSRTFLRNRIRSVAY